MKRFRKHIRLKDFDYSFDRYYFVTICTKNREELFEVRVSKKFGHNLDVAATHASPEINVDEAKRITDITEQCLLDIPKHFPHTELDFYIFMPDHIHLILAIGDASQTKPARGGACPAATKQPLLGTIIGSFKSATSRLSGKSLWQPNYYEHIIRSEANLNRIRNYILKNPWVEHKDINWEKLNSGYWKKRQS